MVYACLFCGETFSLQWNLTRHTQTVHSNHNHECEQCGKILNRKDNYQRHLRSCQRLLTCPYSDGKKFKTSADRRLHIIKNHRDKLFRCEKCSAEFITSRFRDQHKCKVRKIKKQKQKKQQKRIL